MSEQAEFVWVRTMEPKCRRIYKNGKWKSAMTRTFIGATSGRRVKFGIGLLDDEGDAIFWGQVIPHRLITAWRAMWILERMSRADLETVKACYYCMECYRTEDSTFFVRDDEKWLQLLNGQYSGMEVLRASLAMVPISHIELDRMLKVCNDA